MSTIDEIMGAIGRHGDDCIRDSDAASASFEVLRDLIAAALADARRDGAEAMREAAADRIEECDQETERWEYAEHVRALPLPAGERQAVMLTDEQMLSTGQPAYDGLMDHVYEHGTAAEGGRHHTLKMMRAIESAVLAANGLEVRRG